MTATTHTTNDCVTCSSGGHWAVVDGICGCCGHAVEPRPPRRVQMSRQHPWRADNPDAVVVDRRTKWGNPFILGDRQYGLVRYGPEHLARFGRAWDYEGRISAPGTQHDMWFSRDDIVETHVRLATRAEVVELYELAILDPTPGMLAANPSRGGHMVHVTVDEIRAELGGRNLACWCPLDQPCHADVLLFVANLPEVTPIRQPGTTSTPEAALDAMLASLPPCQEFSMAGRRRSGGAA